ncbi:MAG: hypothetical protein JO159_00555 [Acidobacteria bacterium]|nr:hypothetical protein [Acidobacteriota bacterium]
MGEMEKNLNRSGGPKTDAGKQCSSQNSLTHGMCQERFMLLLGESQEAYDALHETWSKQYDLNEPAVGELVKTLVERDWMQQRCTRNICKLEIKLAEAEAADDDAAIEKIERRLNNAWRYKTAAENSFQRALRALEKFRTTRKREEVTQTRINIKRTQIGHEIAIKRARFGVPLPERNNDGRPNPSDNNS